MNCPYTFCPVCGQKYSVCQCDRNEQWNAAIQEAEQDWDNGAGDDADDADDPDDA